jgi:serine/threonine protein kinase
LLNNEYYALKEIPRHKLYTFNKIYSHLTEPNILKKLVQYDFLPKLISSFHDYDNIYLITTYYDGKSLDFFRNDILTEEQIKFASACIIQALIYLRQEKIIHRDIMMKNIILDKYNYFNVIDFSFSIEYSEKDNKEKYMNTYYNVTPPEMRKFKEYDYNSDYYRLGSVIYYLIFKTYPYIIMLQNNSTNITVNYKDVKNYSENCIDFLNKLIISEPEKRIGFKDINELKNHSWFNGYDWNNLEKQKMNSPFKLIENEFDQSLCISISISEQYLIRYKSNSKLKLYKSLINQFDYTNINILNQVINAHKNENNSI